MESRLKIRMSAQDGHYAGGLVDGARILALFGDAATEILIRLDGDEGLLRAYSEVELLAPVYVGDYVEVTARLTRVGVTSREMEFEARKVIRPAPEHGQTAGEALEEPTLVATAKGVCVTPKEKQRKRHE